MLWFLLSAEMSIVAVTIRGTTSKYHLQIPINFSKLWTKKAKAGADQGFPGGGGVNCLKRRHTIILKLSKQCMKLKTFWSLCGEGGRECTGCSARSVNT